jgi:D-glycero-D-manno-heptose 1,7-bisphosphate phosphatase
VGVDEIAVGKPGVFLDRDGVLNELVFNPVTREYESPHVPEDLRMIEGIVPPLRRLAAAGFDLFLISNQPSYAKGKTSLEDLQRIHLRFDAFLKANDIIFRDYYYCYHHPAGLVAGYAGRCECRKPSPYFIGRAIRECGVEASGSWMIGDRDTDIQCGKSGGCRTILMLNEHSSAKRGQVRPDFEAASLAEAAGIILGQRT